MGTPGPVRARATPLKSPTGPVRDCPWFTHSKVKIMDHGASRAWPYGARSNPGARPVKSPDRPCCPLPIQIPCGICTGAHGAVRACPYRAWAHSDPGASPVKFHSGHTWSNSIRGHYLGGVGGFEQLFTRPT